MPVRWWLCDWYWPTGQKGAGLHHAFSGGEFHTQGHGGIGYSQSGRSRQTATGRMRLVNLEGGVATVVRARGGLGSLSGRPAPGQARGGRKAGYRPTRDQAGESDRRNWMLVAVSSEEALRTSQRDSQVRMIRENHEVELT